MDLWAAVLKLMISIHALRVEGDPLPYRFGRRICEFLSTPSGWRATGTIYSAVRCARISIHALRVEGDSCCCII